MPSEHPVDRSLAPWSTKAESYLLFTHLAKLPAEGVYHESEAAWAGDEFGAFKGGLGGVMIVRYSDTPVGKVFLFGVSSCCIWSWREEGMDRGHVT
jgi:hypothetical protein